MGSDSGMNVKFEAEKIKYNIEITGKLDRNMATLIEDEMRS